MPVRLEIKVQPRASRDALEIDAAGKLRLRLRAPAVEGEANRAAMRFLADHFGVAPSRVKLLRGSSSRHKVFEIEGVDPEEARRRLPG
ncbi:MAG: DUF167 domain-containing protein [Acidobacteriota bacterium]